MAGNGRTGALLWAAAWLLFACLLYFVVIPLGIEEAPYASQTPEAFPKLLAATIGTLAVLLFVIEWRELQVHRLERFTLWFFVTPGLAGVYALALEPVGFPLTTAVVLAVLLFIFGERRPAIIGGVAVVTSAVIYGVFVYFMNITLPGGIFG